MPEIGNFLALINSYVFVCDEQNNIVCSNCPFKIDINSEFITLNGERYKIIKERTIVDNRPYLVVKINPAREYRKVYDDLTKLLTKITFQEEVERAVLKSPNTPLFLILADLNDFKNINDIFGHTTGDKVLEFIGEIIRVNFKDQDLIGRFGGDEFAIAFQAPLDFDLENLYERLNKVNAEIRSKTEQYFNVPTRLSFSFGATLYVPTNSYADNLHTADQNMYKAKTRVKAARNKEELTFDDYVEFSENRKKEHIL